jgi:type I restriction enzyme M protein
MIEEKGFFIYPSQLFVNVISKIKSDSDFINHLNEHIDDTLKAIENSAKEQRSEYKISGLFDDYDVNSTRLGATVNERNKRLSKLLLAINDLHLGEFNNNSIDLFGDAYEYLMQMYAANAGKSGGEFFTPQEVSGLLAHLAIGDRKQINKVYDPCCGSGGLLLKFAKILGANHIGAFYGQEKNPTTYNLCRINMFLHDINYEKFDIARGDTLLDPANNHRDEQFEAIVSNPPYSTK